MKKLIVALSLLVLSITAPAWADPAPKVRDVKVRATVMKQYVKKYPGGGVEVRSENICQLEFTTALYDGRVNGSVAFGPGVDCESTLKGQPVRVNVNGFLLLNRMAFENEAPQDVKAASLFLVTHAKNDHGGEIVLPSESAQAAVRDLSTKSIILHAQHMIWAGEGDFASDEQFGVLAEFMDDQQ